MGFRLGAFWQTAICGVAQEGVSFIPAETCWRLQVLENTLAIFGQNLVQ